MSDLEWQQELLYQRFSTWEPKHTVPTLKEWERIQWQEKVIAGQRRLWAAHVAAQMERVNPFLFPVAPESGEDTRQC